MEAPPTDIPPAEIRCLLGDTIDVMATFPDATVDLVLNDPPYGCTANAWDDASFNLERCWQQYERILKPNGIVVLFACSDASDEPFLTKILNSKPHGWKLYTLVWDKGRHSNGTLAEYRPLRYHEDIVVFYRGTHTYNPQKWMKKVRANKNFGKAGGEEWRFPKSILPVFPREKDSWHPTQKPVQLMEWLVKTYSNYGDVVLDNTMGSGATGVACMKHHRSFVGIERDEEYFKKAEQRIVQAKLKELYEPTEVEEDTPKRNALGADVELPKLKDELSFEPKNFVRFYKSLPLDEMEEDEAFIAVIRYLNQYFCAVLGRELRYIERAYKYRPAAEENPYVPTEFIVRSPSEAKRRLMKCKVASGSKEVNVFDIWAEHTEALEYQGLTFDPTNKRLPNKNVLNVFPGLKVADHLRGKTEYDVSKVEVICAHLKALAGDDKVSYEYLLDWMAYPIQTGDKTNIALLVKGQPGCGKGLIFETLMAELIYGQQLAVQLNGGRQISEKFNAAWKKKMLVIIDEPNKLSVSQRDNLKNLITASSTLVSGKFVSDVFEDDYTNYAFTCNHVPEEFLDHDDRRFFIVQHNGKNVMDSQHFAKLRQVIIDEKGYEDFYLFLLSRDIQTFKKGEAPPHTRLKERLMVESVDPIFRYLRHLVDTNTLPPRQPFSVFFDEALAWCSQERMKVSWVRDSLKLKRILKDKLESLEVNKTAGVDGSPGKTARSIIFPPLSDFVDMLTKANVYLKTEEFVEEEKKEAESSQTYCELDDELIDYDLMIDEAETSNAMARLQQLEFSQTELPDIHFDHE